MLKEFLKGVQQATNRFYFVMHKNKQKPCSSGLLIIRSKARSECMCACVCESVCVCVCEREREREREREGEGERENF